MNWQTAVTIIVVLLAAVAVLCWTVIPFILSLRGKNQGRCAGDCACRCSRARDGE